jgi:hypothetical protein
MLAGVPDLRLGELVDWSSAPTPSGKPLRGDKVLLRPFDPAVDAEPLYSASHPPTGDPGIWTYLPDGPYESPQHLQQMLSWAQSVEGHVYYAIEPDCQFRRLIQASIRE